MDGRPTFARGTGPGSRMNAIEKHDASIIVPPKAKQTWKLTGGAACFMSQIPTALPPMPDNPPTSNRSVATRPRRPGGVRSSVSSQYAGNASAPTRDENRNVPRNRPSQTFGGSAPHASQPPNPSTHQPVVIRIQRKAFTRRRCGPWQSLPLKTWSSAVNDSSNTIAWTSILES